jgi:hypothetical protein
MNNECFFFMMLLQIFVCFIVKWLVRLVTTYYCSLLWYGIIELIIAL